MKIFLAVLAVGVVLASGCAESKPETAAEKERTKVVEICTGAGWPGKHKECEAARTVAQAEKIKDEEGEAALQLTKAKEVEEIKAKREAEAQASAAEESP